MEIKKFQQLIWDFYKQNKRTFPWRETKNPYFIFISEICLQQTQTSRVVSKYQEIIEAFPTVESLSNAQLSEVLLHWSGLGYNRRAKYLLEAAKVIVQKYNAVFPADPVVLDELPGVGYNTAAAIVVYSYNKPLVFIETNIRRIFIHHFFEDQEQVSDSEILPLIEKTVDKSNPREWYWALMDYGAMLPKSVINPNRKSAHYIKQSRFEGSVRQVRGSVLKALLQKPLTEAQLRAKINGDAQYLVSVLSTLEKEGFILKNNDVYTLQ